MGRQCVLANLWRPEISDSNCQNYKVKTEIGKMKKSGVLEYEKVATNGNNEKKILVGCGIDFPTLLRVLKVTRSRGRK